jgi:hypothetical protein
MATMAELLIQAWHSHDARRVAALFAEDYLSDQPAHPGRAFTGNEQVLTNWTEVFDGVPDFSAELLASSVAGDTEWTRTGRHPDGSAGWSVTLPRPHPVNARAVTNPTTMGGKAFLWVHHRAVINRGCDTQLEQARVQIDMAQHEGDVFGLDERSAKVRVNLGILPPQ